MDELALARPVIVSQPSHHTTVFRSVLIAQAPSPMSQRHAHICRSATVRHSGQYSPAELEGALTLGFAVMGTSTLWWGGCAWDSFAIPHLVDVEPDVLVATRCPGCDNPHAWVVGRDEPPPGEQVVHFLVPVARMWEDALHTCGHQRIFCREACVGVWLARTSYDRGYVMDLPTLWRLARGWYAGRLDRGYTRREPAAAAAYLAEVGLEGPFWGL